MEPNQDRSLTLRPSNELAAPQIGANRILCEMVERSLAVANEVTKEAELDALVQEAKRLQKEGGSNKMATNFVRAFQLFLRAAEGGHVEAQYQVAECYVWGAGVPHDIVESDRWLRLAAENGHMYAQSDLGVYRLGKSEESVKWLRKAAEQGESSAFDFLGFRLVSGAGVPQDKCEGYAWLRLAVDARKEDNWLQEQVAAIASSLSSAQLEKALELYEGFKRKYSTE